MSDRQFLLLLRVVLVTFTLAALLFALNSKSTMYEMVQNAYKVTLVSCIVPLAAGIYWKRATNARARCCRWCSACVSWAIAEWTARRCHRAAAARRPRLLASLGMVLGSLVPRAGAGRGRPQLALMRASPLARILFAVYRAADVLRVASIRWRAGATRAFAVRLPDRAVAALCHRASTSRSTSLGYVPFGFLAAAALQPRLRGVPRLHRRDRFGAAALSLSWRRCRATCRRASVQPRRDLQRAAAPRSARRSRLRFAPGCSSRGRCAPAATAAFLPGGRASTSGWR